MDKSSKKIGEPQKSLQSFNHIGFVVLTGLPSKALMAIELASPTKGIESKETRDFEMKLPANPVSRRNKRDD